MKNPQQPQYSKDPNQVRKTLRSNILITNTHDLTLVRWYTYKPKQ